MERLICLAIGYLFGLFQTGYFYGKLNHIDIRNHGSGNAGTTNALRTLGWKAGIITFVGDCLKCVFAVFLVRQMFAANDNVQLLAFYAGLGAVLGHNFPFYLQFKGGKGIASTVGLMLSIYPKIFFVVIVIFLVLFLLTQYVSLSSLVIMIVFFVQIVYYGQTGVFQLTGMELYEFYGLAAVFVILAFIRHRANIKRLLNGTENKINVWKIGKK